MRQPLFRGALALALAAAAPLAFGQPETTPAQPETAPESETAAQPEAAAPSPEESRTIASYALGFQIGGNFATERVDLDLDAFVTGLRAATASQDAAYTPEQMQQAVAAFQQEVAAAQQARIAAEGAANLAAGQAFLEQNAAREGVTVLPSGLQIETLVEGTGDTPDATDQVSVHYTGTLVDGTVFDSSRERGQPAIFPLSGVIDGFEEGLSQLKEGGRAKLYIPPAIGYGERGGGPIPPNATLIFDVELLDVIDTAAAPAPGEDPAPADQPEQ
jgi:FKBP-type peptidyl-prolyl cis-trans isomerase